MQSSPKVQIQAQIDWQPQFMRRIVRWLLALGGIVLVTILLVPFQPIVNTITVAFAYLLIVLLTATFIGRNPALLASVAATLCFNYFFLPPIYSLTISDSQNWTALAAFLITSLVAGQLSMYARQQADEARRGQREIERLYQQMQAAFEQASHAEALRQSEKLKSALLDAVTHDLRTPLTSIKAAITTVLDDEKTDDETFKLDNESRLDFFEVINEETDRLNRFIENMVELARQEAGAMRLRLRWSSAEEIIGAALERAEKQLCERRVVLEIERELPLVQADAKALAEVLFTLLDNAAKYSSVNTEIKIAATRHDDETIKIAVADKGRGVAPEMREKVFEKFFRAELNSEDDAAANGLGLGLAVARGIIESHNGRIWIEASETNENSGGTTVAFVVPVGDEDE